MAKLMNNVVSVFVILIIGLLLIPLSPFLLDFMFIVNIAVSIMILLTTMYIRRALEFSIFPTMLLITTLFRLALSVSSTRAILMNGGEAGQVIKTFGQFVMGGNPVVGFIIFIIIVIVQFVVITKGAERVAEVSARFTLDSMPGKQMAIDADLSAGLINEDEAKQRRRDVQREAEFFGAMDGATKFVKGDAIMSIVTAFINLIGGTIIGMVMLGQPIGDVINIYSIATVGDGLVSQIPALLISTATGMVVTRSASDGDLNTDVIGQFAAQPTALIISGGIIAALNFIPGTPHVQLLIIAGLLIFMGVTLRRPAPAATATAGTAQDIPIDEISETSYYKNVDNIYSLINVEPIEMEFGYSLIPLVDERDGGSFIDRIVMFRKQFATDMGVVVPTVRLRDNGLINPNQYLIKIKGEEVARGEVLVDYYLALDPGRVSKEIEGIDTVEPAYGIPGKWIVEELRELAEIYGYTVIDSLSVIVTHLSEICKRHMHELLSRQDVNTLLSNTSKLNESLVRDVVPSLVPVSELQKVLGNLLREGIPVRDMETILETLGDYASNVKDTDMLTEYVRQRLRRTITRKYTDGNVLKVITLDQDIEKLILSGVKKSEHGTYMAIDPDTVQGIVSATLEQVKKIKDVVSMPIVLTSPVVRVYFKKMMDQFYPNLIVLSFSEIDPAVQIQALSNIEL